MVLTISGTGDTHFYLFTFFFFFKPIIVYVGGKIVSILDTKVRKKKRIVGQIKNTEKLSRKQLTNCLDNRPILNEVYTSKYSRTVGTFLMLVLVTGVQ